MHPVEKLLVASNRPAYFWLDVHAILPTNRLRWYIPLIDQAISDVFFPIIPLEALVRSHSGPDEINMVEEQAPG